MAGRRASRDFGETARDKGWSLGAQDGNGECSKRERKGDLDQRREGQQRDHETDTLNREGVKGHAESGKVYVERSNRKAFKGFGRKHGQHGV